MVVNRVDATLSKADQQAILDAIRSIRERLPFLTELTTGERQALPRMGEKSRAFVDKALELAREDPDLLPEDFDVEGMERDLELYDALQPLIFSVMQLQDLMFDTSIAVSGDVYSAALAVHEQAKEVGQAEALDEIVAEMEDRFQEEASDEEEA
ncbi:MAG: hypothetical protein ACLFU8_09625 [Anaerolineales bacterium]